MILKPSEVTGVILAGGRASRIGGGDKGLLGLGTGALLDRVIGSVSGQVRQLAINANGDPGRFAAFGLPVIPDQDNAQLGPLAGLLAGLRWSQRECPECLYMLSVPADAPFLPSDLVARLASPLPQDRPGIAIPASNGRAHWVIGLWPVAMADRLQCALANGERAAHRFAGQENATIVAFEPIEAGGATIDPFFNVNTPDDLAEAQRVCTLRSATAVAERECTIVGIVGWKGAGKTTLACKLISFFRDRGYRVASIKHSHHKLADLDRRVGAGDTGRHGAAGAHQTVLVARDGILVDGSLIDGAAPTLQSALALSRDCDFIVVEGFKHAAIPKIEVRRHGGGDGGGDGPGLAESDANVVAIVTDQPVSHGRVPVFELDDVTGIAALVANITGRT